MKAQSNPLSELDRYIVNQILTSDSHRSKLHANKSHEFTGKPFDVWLTEVKWLAEKLKPGVLRVVEGIEVENFGPTDRSSSYIAPLTYVRAPSAPDRLVLVTSAMLSNPIDEHTPNFTITLPLEGYDVEKALPVINVDSNHVIAKYLIAMHGESIYSNVAVTASTELDLKTPQEMIQILGSDKVSLIFDDLYIREDFVGYINFGCRVTIDKHGIVNLVTNLRNGSGKNVECFVNWQGTHHGEVKEVSTQVLPSDFGTRLKRFNFKNKSSQIQPVSSIPTVVKGSELYRTLIRLIYHSPAQRNFNYDGVRLTPPLDNVDVDRIRDWIYPLPTPKISDLFGVKYVTVSEMKIDDVTYSNARVLYGVIVSLTWCGRYYINFHPYKGEERLPSVISYALNETGLAERQCGTPEVLLDFSYETSTPSERPKVEFTSNDPLTKFIIDSVAGGDCMDVGWMASTLMPTLIKMDLKVGDILQSTDLKIGDFPNQVGDEYLTLKVIEDPVPTSGQVTLYALESNIPHQGDKVKMFYIVATNFDHDVGLISSNERKPLIEHVSEFQVKFNYQGQLPNHIVFNPATKSYYKYKLTQHEGILPSESELVTFIDVEVKPNSSKILRGWTLEELEAIVKHLKEQK